ncbi:MAG TPA: hypothetical protein VMX75_02220, partial [Spirochaetia bacterium]|nr:hypothetical protein [Spirochaetia bacterium]
MAAKKLSPEETELALTKIIKKYDEYIYRFFKLPKVKTAFEERYFSVIKNGLDMARFLSMEISVIEELIKKEEDKLITEIAPQQKTEKKEGYADRVLKELKAKIEKYPEIRIHKDANPEIRRLLGALGDLDKKYMPPLQDALKNTNYAFNTQIMMNLDAQLRSLSGGLEGIPARLTRYLTQLNVFPRDYKSLDREEKAYILEAS